jgi:hypothetical protein
MWLTFIAIGASAFTGSAMTRTHVARAQPAMANRADEPWNADIIAKSMPTMADLACVARASASAVCSTASSSPAPGNGGCRRASRRVGVGAWAEYA